MQQHQKLCTKVKAVINRRKRSNTPNEVNPLENINENPKSFLEMRFPVKLLKSIESFIFAWKKNSRKVWFKERFISNKIGTKTLNIGKAELES